MLYYRAAATESGHIHAGHGDFENMKRRAGMSPEWSALKFKRSLEQEEMNKRFAVHVSQSEKMEEAQKVDMPVSATA